MLKVALTHDVDRIRKTYQYVTYPIKSLYKLNFEEFLYQSSSLFRKNPYWCFAKIIEIENEYKVKSTFFFLNEPIKFNLYKPSNWSLSLGRYKFSNFRLQNIIRFLDLNGWEIGLHGSYLSFNDLKLIKLEKFLLEKIIQHKINGIRQHYLNLSTKTWEYQKNAGFLYDSSFGYTNEIGFKDKKFSPFFPLDNKFTVFPQIIMDSCYMNTKNRRKELSRILDLSEEKDSILVINWHQRSFNSKEFPGYTKQYGFIIEECIKRNAIFKTLSEFLNETKN